MGVHGPPAEVLSIKKPQEIITAGSLELGVETIVYGNNKVKVDMHQKNSYTIKT